MKNIRIDSIEVKIDIFGSHSRTEFTFRLVTPTLRRSKYQSKKNYNFNESLIIAIAEVKMTIVR